MEAGHRRGRGRVLRPRGRAPATPRNRARPREDDATIALLRQQQEIMAQMVDFFLERQSVLHPPKRPRTEFASPNRTWEAPHRAAPTPQTPPQRMVASAAIGETEGASNPFSVPPPGH
jgi:hypothetical protein